MPGPAKAVPVTWDTPNSMPEKWSSLEFHRGATSNMRGAAATGIALYVLAKVTHNARLKSRTTR